MSDARNTTSHERQRPAFHLDEAWSAAVFTVSLDAIVGMDHTGAIVAFNPAAEEMFGRRAADVIGLPLADVIVPPELRDRHRQGLARHLATGEVHVLGRRVELRALRADGTDFPAEIVVTRIPGSDLPAFVGFVRDLSARREAEERRDRAEAELLDADRQKDQFIATLGHELRNPLAAIGNATSVLERLAETDDRLRPLHGVLQRQVRHMGRLVDGLLDVSRVARGKMLVERTRLDLGALAASVAEDQRPVFEQCGLSLRVDVREPLVVDGDPVRLAQVVGNLLANACRFTSPPGEVVITARRDGDEAVLVVRDTGMGIEPAVLPLLFEPFRQAGGPDAMKGGLGLGLPLVRGILSLHGGRIEAASDGPGTGATFTARVPLA